jgi:hypothetical protein
MQPQPRDAGNRDNETALFAVSTALEASCLPDTPFASNPAKQVDSGTAEAPELQELVGKPQCRTEGNARAIGRAFMEVGA